LEKWFMKKGTIHESPLQRQQLFFRKRRNLLNEIQSRQHAATVVAPCGKTKSSVRNPATHENGGCVPESIRRDRFSLNVDDLHAFPNAGRESEHYTFFRINCSQAGRCTRCFLKEESLMN
jgi:hypothetical protein